MVGVCGRVRDAGRPQSNELCRAPARLTPRFWLPILGWYRKPADRIGGGAYVRHNSGTRGEGPLDSVSSVDDQRRASEMVSGGPPGDAPVADAGARGAAADAAGMRSRTRRAIRPTPTRRSRWWRPSCASASARSPPRRATTPARPRRPTPCAPTEPTKPTAPPGATAMPSRPSPPPPRPSPSPSPPWPTPAGRPAPLSGGCRRSAMCQPAGRKTRRRARATPRGKG